MSKKNQSPVLTNDLRETLKAVMLREIEQLPKHLEELDHKERLNMLCKLMPFVFPKVDAVSHKDGEPFEW